MTQNIIACVYEQEECEDRDEQDGEHSLEAGVVLAVEGPPPPPHAAPLAAAPEQSVQVIYF